MSDCQEYYLIFAIKKSKLKPDTQRAHWLHSLTRDQESLKEARLTPPGGLGQYNVPHTVLGGSRMPAPTIPHIPSGARFHTDNQQQVGHRKVSIRR